MENVLFKISFPAEFHAQTAIECAITLHDNEIIKLNTVDKIKEIDKIIITTHESAIRIIDKTGPLNNPADRDHCIQYMVAIGLLKGNLTAQDYENQAAQDPKIDLLREKMICEELNQYTHDYLDVDKRSITNAIQIFYKDGTLSKKIVVEYPIGHKLRRDEGIPKLVEKFKTNLAREFNKSQAHKILSVSLDQKQFEKISVNEYIDLFWKEEHSTTN
jgi:2-methylcitrate dehydratase PrpD